MSEVKTMIRKIWREDVLLAEDDWTLEDSDEELSELLAENWRIADIATVAPSEYQSSSLIAYQVITLTRYSQKQREQLIQSVQELIRERKS